MGLRLEWPSLLRTCSPYEMTFKESISKRLPGILVASALFLVVSGIGTNWTDSANAAPAAVGPDFALVKNINPTGSSDPHNLTAFCCNRPILFAADDGTNGIELWVTTARRQGHSWRGT